MTHVTADEAKKSLLDLVKTASISHEPILITSKKNNAVLISEDDWRSIQETLYLLSIPKMRKSIKDGLKIPINECSEKLEW